MAQNINLEKFPPVFLLPTHLTPEELIQTEKQLDECGARLTYNVSEAGIILGNIQQKRRAIFELQSRNIQVMELSDDAKTAPIAAPPGKKQRLNEPSRDSRFRGAPEVPLTSSANKRKSINASKNSPSNLDNWSGEKPPEALNVLKESSLIQVVNIAWFRESSVAGTVLPLPKYVVYEGIVTSISSNPVVGSPNSHNQSKFRSSLPVAVGVSISEPNQNLSTAEEILSRAQHEGTKNKPKVAWKRLNQQGGDARFRSQIFASTSQTSNAKQRRYPPQLIHEDTSEFEDDDGQHLPEMPDWVKSHSRYSCERATPIDSPNNSFLIELKKIRTARILTGDQIGVRAYSTSIAAIAAFPYGISSPRQILALPGCDAKIVSLWTEWKENDGRIKVSEEIENDETMKVLRLFYEIWGVGDKTAREFYFDRGWRDLDDIVEHGWSTLTRVQQIGVKFYEEFSNTISRVEVEFIADKIREHAIRIRGEGVETCIVGGYRRGKEESGDVDIIVSHRDPEMSLGIVKDIVVSLENEGWITHTLLLSLNTSKRDQATLPYRMDGGGHGFDSLDKALVVWQNPDWDEKDSKDHGAKNPNIHRRVDIIISPWRTVGCAVMGWSGGTTFQRDLRRYAKYVKGWKFDSSGVRDRATGKIVDLEGDPDTKLSPEEAERRVFAGFGLEYREPWERCTG